MYGSVKSQSHVRIDLKIHTCHSKIPRLQAGQSYQISWHMETQQLVEGLAMINHFLLTYRTSRAPELERIFFQAFYRSSLISYMIYE